MKTKTLLTLAAISLAATTFGAMAQDSVSGQYEYMNHCASCHGESGMGDGPIAGILTVDVPDLTTLSINNDGEFPYLDTFMVIDGRTGVRGHGSNMPVWGDTFSREGMEQAGDYGGELVARGRLMSLVEYLVTIQQD